MLNNSTIEKLNEMHITAMAKAFKAQCEDSAVQALSFDDRFGLLVDSEWTSRKNNRLKRLIWAANFPFTDACLENVEYLPDRGLDRVKITKYGTCGYIESCNNLIIMGATGGGKTYLASAFGMAACRNFFTVKYIRLPELLAEIAMSKADGNYKNVMKRYKLVRLLIIDDWLIFPLKDTEAHDVLEIAEARYKKGSTIFCSQMDIGGWHEKFGESVIADAVCDRIAHESYKITIGGLDSMRKRKGLQPEG